MTFNSYLLTFGIRTVRSVGHMSLYMVFTVCKPTCDISFKTLPEIFRHLDIARCVVQSPRLVLFTLRRRAALRLIEFHAVSQPCDRIILW